MSSDKIELHADKRSYRTVLEIEGKGSSLIV